MKHLLVWLGLAALFTGLHSGMAAQPAARDNKALDLARVHFVGFNSLNEQNGSTLKEIWELPVTAEFRNQSLGKMSAAISSLLKPRAGQSGEGSAGLIQPLLEDLLRREWLSEWGVSPQDAPMGILAVQLDPAGLRRWENALRRLISGYDFKPELEEFSVAYAATNTWMILAVSPGTKTDAEQFLAGSALLARAKNQSGAAQQPGHFLKLEADLDRIWGPALGELGKLPRIDLTVSGRGERLRTEGRLVFSEPQNWRLEKWNIPTNTIQDPNGTLMSFTAVQSLQPYLAKFPMVREIGINPIPNQAFAWGQSFAPLQVYVAVPLPGVTNFIRHFGKQWIPKINPELREAAVGELQVLTNRTAVNWRGLGIPVPFLRPGDERDKDFIVAGVFPVSGNQTKNPLPSELIDEVVKRRGLIYYDWEITQARLEQLRFLAQVFSLGTTITDITPQMAGGRWLTSIMPGLGNTITEVTVNSPRELSFARTSHAGLNGLELMALVTWLESPKFPVVEPIRFRPFPKSERESRENRRRGEE